MDSSKNHLKPLLPKIPAEHSMGYRSVPTSRLNLAFGYKPVTSCSWRMPSLSLPYSGQGGAVKGKSGAAGFRASGEGFATRTGQISLLQKYSTNNVNSAGQGAVKDQSTVTVNESSVGIQEPVLWDEYLENFKDMNATLLAGLLKEKLEKEELCTTCQKPLEKLCTTCQIAPFPGNSTLKISREHQNTKKAREKWMAFITRISDGSNTSIFSQPSSGAEKKVKASVISGFIQPGDQTHKRRRTPGGQESYARYQRQPIRPEPVEGRELRAHVSCKSSFDSAQDERRPGSKCRNYLRTNPKCRRTPGGQEGYSRYQSQSICPENMTATETSIQYATAASSISPGKGGQQAISVIKRQPMVNKLSDTKNCRFEPPGKRGKPENNPNDTLFPSAKTQERSQEESMKFVSSSTPDTWTHSETPPRLSPYNYDEDDGVICQNSTGSSPHIALLEQRSTLFPSEYN